MRGSVDLMASMERQTLDACFLAAKAECNAGQKGYTGQGARRAWAEDAARLVRVIGAGFAAVSAKLVTTPNGPRHYQAYNERQTPSGCTTVAWHFGLQPLLQDM